LRRRCLHFRGNYTGETRFNFPANRKTELKRFLSDCNGDRPYKGIDGLTPKEKLIDYFYSEKL